MSLRTVLLFVMLVTSVGLSPTAHGAWWHEFGRECGLGWSDGYHSRTGCTKRRSPCPTCQPTPAQEFEFLSPAQPLPASAPVQRTTWRTPSPGR